MKMVFVLALVLLAGVAAWHLLLTPATSISVGSTLSLEGVTFPRESASLLLVLSADCPVCDVEAPYYAEFAQEAQAQGLTVIAIQQDSPENAKAWLRDRGILTTDISTTEPRELGFLSVPVVGKVDASGVVSHLWTGPVLQNPSVRSQIFETLFDEPASISESKGKITAISEDELERFLNSTDSVVILDPRSREVYAEDHRSGSRNIPLDELAVRATRELSGFKTIVIDCSALSGPLCLHAVKTLTTSTPASPVILGNSLTCTDCPEPK